MKQGVKRAASFFSIGLSVVFLLGLHLSSAALVPVGHTAEGANHGSNASIGCATACNSVNLQKKDHLSENEDVKDHEPEVPHYAQSQTSALIALAKQHNQEARLTIEREPSSGGPPAYIALSVFRT